MFRDEKEKFQYSFITKLFKGNSKLCVSSAIPLVFISSSALRLISLKSEK